MKLFKKALSTSLICFSLMAGVSHIAAPQSVQAASVKPEDIVAAAREYIGTPYRSGGSSSNGFDCSGYTSFVYKKFNVKLPRTSSSQYSVGKKVDRKNLQTGDLVFFRTGGGGISHVGIYIGKNTFIHSQNGKGVSVSSLNDPYYWKSRYVGATRVI